MTRFMLGTAFIACLSAVPAAAATVTFANDYLDDDTQTALSDGFLFETSLNYSDGETLYLHDDGGVTTSQIRAVSGQRFTALSIMADAYSNIYKSGDAALDPDADYSDLAAWAHGASPVQPMFTLSGFRDGVAVSMLNIPVGILSSVLLPGFIDLDYILAEMSVPGGPSAFFFPEDVPAGAVWCDMWCGGVRLDDMVVADTASPVPLPASLPLLAGGLLALVFWRKKRRVAA